MTDMKMKEYNAENTREGAAGRKLSNGVTMSVYRTGVITFSSGLAALAGISEGDRLAFGQDEQYPKDWRIYPSQKGFTVKGYDMYGGRTAKKRRGLKVESVALAAEILASAGLDGVGVGGLRYPATLAEGGVIALDPMHVTPIFRGSRNKGKEISPKP